MYPYYEYSQIFALDRTVGDFLKLLVRFKWNRDLLKATAYANSECPDQTERLRGLIRTFVVRI